MVVIGIDPDSDKHGVAVYIDGELKELHSYTIIDVIDWVITNDYRNKDVEFHIEDVRANNAIFRSGNNKKVQMSIARRLGMVQQAQLDLERLLFYYNLKVVKHKISKMWKKDRAMFEKITGWKGRSNEDTRSAAYFGWLGLKNANKS